MACHLFHIKLTFFIRLKIEIIYEDQDAKSPYSTRYSQKTYVGKNVIYEVRSLLTYGAFALFI